MPQPGRGAPSPAPCCDIMSCCDVMSCGDITPRCDITPCGDTAPSVPRAYSSSAVL